MKEEIERLFVENAELIRKQYSKSLETSILITEAIIVSRLEESLLDAKKMDFVTYSGKYLNKHEFFEYKDFSVSEIKRIIDETPLTERDRNIALLRYVELRSEEEISDLLYIDKKTVHTNIPKVSICLKRTASRLHSK